MGGRKRGRQHRSFHRQLLVATEPLTVAIECPDGPGGTALGRPESGTSPLGVPAGVPPIARRTPA